MLGYGHLSCEATFSTPCRAHYTHFVTSLFSLPDSLSLSLSLLDSYIGLFSNRVKAGGPTKLHIIYANIDRISRAV